MSNVVKKKYNLFSDRNVASAAFILGILLSIEAFITPGYQPISSFVGGALIGWNGTALLRSWRNKK